uniref:Uncharacterized protein n=1 Tax=Siphoviridae sp. ct8aS59 TaxID=2825365 RepID=A0A8S5TSX6_9CAUD|nr:MAG TPA: hypothetical protein [Siphoviridae sp. ct8aS59]
MHTTPFLQMTMYIAAKRRVIRFYPIGWQAVKNA